MRLAWIHLGSFQFIRMLTSSVVVTHLAAGVRILGRFIYCLIRWSNFNRQNFANDLRAIVFEEFNVIHRQRHMFKLHFHRSGRWPMCYIGESGAMATPSAFLLITRCSGDLQRSFWCHLIAKSIGVRLTPRSKIYNAFKKFCSLLKKGCKLEMRKKSMGNAEHTLSTTAGWSEN